MNSPIAGKNRTARLAAAAAAVSVALVSRAFAQSNVSAGQVVVSVSGSTALKNWLVANTNTFTDIQPNTTLSINGTSYPLASDGGASYWNNGVSYQLAPKNNASIQGGTTDQSPAIQFIYHESGSVEGILELANDQLYTNSNYAPATGIPSTSIAYVTQNVDRNPEGGNAVWLNYNQIGASGVTAGTTFNATTGAAPANTNVTLGNFYGTGVGQSGTPGESSLWVPGSASNPTPTFTQAGVNVNGGQNAVQVAMSDAIPQQVFQNNYGNTSNTYTPVGGSSTTVTGSANSSFNSNPLDQGFGQGNPALTTGPVGTAGFRAEYQSPGVLNMPANAQNPRAPQGTDFGVGAWNNATNGGLGNLNSQLTAITATAFVANPGTGLTQLDRTDADWLETTSRLANGAGFNMTTRDVNSGTRNVSSLDTGIDPTYSTGKNDDGNGNLTNGVSNTVFDQESIGPAIRFSNKTAGGAQLRPTVQNNRMAVGTLSINDAGGHDTQGIANPVVVLNYSDSVDGSAPYVSPNYATISNGTYVIYQNEQVVTVRAPGANYATNIVATVNAGTVNAYQQLQGQIQGDDSSGDVVTLLNNTASSTAATGNAPSPANPGDGLLSQGYIIPSLMQVMKNFNGQGLVNSSPGTIDTGSIQSQSNLLANGGSFNQALYNAYSGPGGYGPSKLPILTGQEPTTGTGSTYGGQGGTFAKTYFNGPGKNVLDQGGAAIPITSNNYLFGNFNQNGVRDYSAVQSALFADRALISADQAVGASVPGSEFTSQGDNNGVAGGTDGVLNTTIIDYTDINGVMHTNLSKGDLIVMGDFNGDGHFDGADLKAMAENSALADAAGDTTLGADNYQNGVLVKNAAMDWLNSEVGTTGADAYIRKTAAAVLEGTSVPFGATAITNPVSGSPVIDPVSGLAEFTYDPTGANAFNKSDINGDGVVDFNDAVIADNENGQDFSNLGDQINATMPAPVTGTPVPLNLALVKQSDGSTVINASDVAVVNSQLTGTGNANWYGYDLNKTGPSTITWARTGGTVTVYPGATFTISSGAVVVNGSLDPFTDNNAPGAGSTAGNHVKIVNNASLSVNANSTIGGITGTGTLNIGSGTPNTLQLATNSGGSSVGSLSIANTTGSALDVTNNHIIINYDADPKATILGYLATGSNNGAWNGPGIMSSTAANLPGQNYGVGFEDGADGLDPNLTSGQIQVGYAQYGDITMQGLVNANDFHILASNFGQVTTEGWEAGDFLYTGTVNAEDFHLLAENFGQTASGEDVQMPASEWAAIDAFAAANGLSAPAAVPEPTGLIGLIGVGVLARRRRRQAQ